MGFDNLPHFNLRNLIKRGAIAEIIALTIAVLFTILLSVYLALLYRDFNFTISDLGLAYHTEYLFIHSGHFLNWPTSNLLITPSTYGKLFYVPLSLTVLIYDTPVSILLAQSLMIGVSSFVVYRIVLVKTNNSFAAIGAELIFILYPGTYGILPNGGNYVTFLEPFVLISYYFFIRNKKVLSFSFAVIAMITSPLGPIVVSSLFVLELLMSKWNGLLKKLRIRKADIRSEGVSVNFAVGKFTLAILCSAFALIGVILLTTPISTLIPTVYSSSSASQPIGSGASSVSFLVNLWERLIYDAPAKLNFINETMTGVLYLPLLSPYGLLIGTYYGLNSVSDFFPYYSFVNHYTFVFAAFVFLGLAWQFNKLKKYKKILNKFVALIILSSIFSFLIWSPFNIGSIQDGMVSTELHLTSTQGELNHALSLIPSNASVFFQNDFPQMMNRSNVYLPGYYSGQPVDYAIISPFPVGVISAGYIGFNGTWAQYFIDNPSYGIYEFVNGTTIFKLGYHGAPVYYIPFKNYYVTNKFVLPGIIGSSPLFSPAYSTFVPGNYSIDYTISMSKQNKSTSNFTVYEGTWIYGTTYNTTYENYYYPIQYYSPIQLKNLTQIANNTYEYSVFEDFNSYTSLYQLNLWTNSEINYSPFIIDNVSVSLIKLGG